MSLSSSQLDAFSEVVRTSSFSKAAKSLSITQSALSQRIKNLEEELGISLLIREPSGIRLTHGGEKLLQYCHGRNKLEIECLNRINDPESVSLAGIVRVAGYSTIMRSIVLPAVSPLLIKNPKVGLEVATREMRDLPKSLQTGETDFIFLDYAWEREGIESHWIGNEENVLIEPSSGKVNTHVFLDHDPDDETTFRFLKSQGKQQIKVQRLFLDEIYGIIDGVALGLGRAVVPRHLIKNDKRVRMSPNSKPYLTPIYLHCYHQSFYTQLQKVVINCLMIETKTRLIL